MKRIVTIQDISCVGKCSLTVALPIISAMGVETAILPTAVLSTHTMFPSPTCADLTDEIEPISRHWVSQDLDFDAIYTGYLASGRQISLVSRFFQTFRREGTPVIVDPAMADNGNEAPVRDPLYGFRKGRRAPFLKILRRFSPGKRDRSAGIDPPLVIGVAV